MKIVIPLAGFGKRLRPHTFTKPKPLINVAGKPVLGHVLDMFAKLDNVEEIIFIVGHLGDQIADYVSTNYPHIQASYFEQKELNGQSTAIYLARERLTTGPMLMVFVDTLVEADLTKLKSEPADAVAWVKAVEDPRRFGVAELGPDGYVTRLIEKPNDVKNNLVVVGFYYFKDAALLMDCIREQLARDIRTKEEYFLADAVNLMLQRGVRMRVQKVDIWQDCGTTETVLEANRYLLDTSCDNSQAVKNDDYLIVPPVNIHPTAQIKRSVIGPHATVAAHCQVEDSIIRDSILDEGAVVDSVSLSQSLIGRTAKVTGRFRTFNVGEASEVGFE
jgi:glucose-1-phosphate thymidylyltransferase